MRRSPQLALVSYPCGARSVRSLAQRQLGLASLGKPIRSYATVLAYEGDTLVGTARAISDGERKALIIAVALLPAYQRRGIGTAMRRDLIQRLDGCAIILTSSEDENTPFYSGLGVPHPQTRNGPPLPGQRRNRPGIEPLSDHDPSIDGYGSI